MIDGQWYLEHGIEQGDEAVIEWTMTWRDPKSGEKRLDRGTEWFLIRDGKIAEVRAYHHGNKKNPQGDLLGFDHEGRGYTMLEDWKPPTVTVIKDTGERALLPPFTRGARGASRVGRRLRLQGDRPQRGRVGGGARVPSRALTRAAASSASSASSTPRSWAARAATTSTTRSGPRSWRARAQVAASRPGLGAHTGDRQPPIFKFGTPEQHQRFLVPAIKGEKICALGITEPGAGSDVASIRRSAEKVDGGYVVNGSKTFITNGVRADFLVTAVKTTEEGGHNGISFLVLEREMPGYEVVSQAGEDGLALLGHRRALLHRRRGARGEPARGARTAASS